MSHEPPAAWFRQAHLENPEGFIVTTDDEGTPWRIDVRPVGVEQ